MATLAQWYQGARPKTLTLAISPILVGSACAYVVGKFDSARAICALLISLCLQIGVNYANDYSDGIKGTDDNRVGPARLTGGQLARPQHVKVAAFTFLGLGALLGLVLVIISQSWIFLLIGPAAILAAWTYTGTKNPYGYKGLGEVVVFIFFGLMATLGTMYVQSHEITLICVLGAISIGLLACAVLLANNIRDIDGDLENNKLTLAVRLGKKRARIVYIACLWIALILPFIEIMQYPWLGVLVILAIPMAILTHKINTATVGGEFIQILKKTSILSLVFAIFFTLGLILSV